MRRFFLRTMPAAVFLSFPLIFSPHRGAAEIPEYRVVIDPGHGGVNVQPPEKFGDRFDVLSGKFLEVFREGASYKGIDENVIMYQISSKVKDLLVKTETDEGFADFSRILAKYSVKHPERIIIKTFLSRKDSMKREEQIALPDPNAGYRLFDYPDSQGKMQMGRLSYINSLKPHLVVSLHCAAVTSKDRIGMNAVIAPPYSFFKKGLDVLQKKSSDKRFFSRSRYADWFEENYRRSLYKWFLNDTYVYFAGYPLDARGNPDSSKFKGYGRNMVQWAYADEGGWEKTAAKHPAHSSYAKKIDQFVPSGKFWSREQSVFEEYRRGDGPEGYGGDNFYSSQEIIRYVLWSVKNKGFSSNDLRIAPPYISTWIVPMHVNAISAYIELGYLKVPAYRHVLVDMQDDVAEGIAVGIYSLFAGIDMKNAGKSGLPKGKKIDFSRYITDDGKSYFETVVK